jgi:hypothetical protein
MAPPAPGPHDIEQTVEHPPHVRRPWPAARLRRRDERLDQAVLRIAQGLAAPQVAHRGAVLGRPQRRSPSRDLPPRTTIGQTRHRCSAGNTDLFKRALRMLMSPL